MAARSSDPLAPFGPAVRAWFEATFEAPTDAEARGWAAIAQGEHTLIHAPTGSGKTLAAFLWCLDRIAQEPSPEPKRGQPGTIRTLYVSPLKALAYDVERNLRAPLAGIALAAQRLGLDAPRITIASRTGDTPQDERRDIVRHPPDILVTTPESLYLLLTSQAREILRGVEHVIVDEVHAVAGTKRGAHLALSLERLERLRAQDAKPVQRIGLSATQRPLETIGRYLGGAGDGRQVTIVDAGARKPLDLKVVVPVEDMSRLGEVLPMDEQPGGPVLGGEMRNSIWPAIHPQILELIRSHRSTIVFTNSRRLAERLAQRLNELAGEELVRAHHGSIAREQRLEIEEELKAGRLPALVATSSLELGIDMGAVDLVVQVESPTSVARGLQRIGRAGHQVGEASKGVIFPKYRGDLLETAVVVRGMRDGAIEPTTLPRNPLDVLAQQIVAWALAESFTVDELLTAVRRAAPFETLTREALEGVLGMPSGAYLSDAEFAELKPRITWDRLDRRGGSEDRCPHGRRDQRRHHPGPRPLPRLPRGRGPHAGSKGAWCSTRRWSTSCARAWHGDAGRSSGASSWRGGRDLANRDGDASLGIPVPPFWKGDAIGRPVELGKAIGVFTREAETDLAKGAKGRAKATERLRSHHDLDDLAAENLLAYLEDEREAAGALPTDKRIVVERFRDELGDWRLVILTPFGGRVHAPWTMAIEARITERLGLDIQTIWSDDGIAIRLPEGDGSLAGVEELLFPDADDVEDLVVGRVGQSSLFASRFRENAARALLLPRRRPGTRTPLWQQRQRAADLLAVASRYGSFPILVETYRECLADVFDLPALREILAGVASREITVHAVETARASAFASSLLFDYVAAYMYEGDAPLAERRAQALTLDRDLLRELLGQEELRELLDVDALSDLELSLQHLTEERWAKTADQVHDLLRRLGDLTPDEAGARTEGGRVEAVLHLAELASSRRAIRARIAGEERWIAMEDVARYRDGVGVAPPPGVPQAFLAPAPGALDGLLARYARSHGPFTADEPARRWGLPAGVVDDALHRLVAAGTLLAGEFRPGGATREFCDPEVLRSLRRRSLAKLRHEVEPVEPVTLARFLPAWHGVAPVAGGGDQPRYRGDAALERLAQVVDQLAGMPIPASVLERDVLPARIPGYQPRLLDELGAMGEVAWVGRGSLGRDDGRVVLYRPGRELLRPSGLPEGVARPDSPLHDRLRAHLARRGACFYRELFAAAGGRTDREVLDALWDLVWAGEVTNDTVAPLRALRWKRPAKDHKPRPGRLTALGPPEAAGRWSLVDLPAPDGEDEDGFRVTAPSRTERIHAQALALLERHGVLTREAVAGEAVDGGFSAVYPVLRMLEEGGRIRRGYFVDGLGAAQFALPGAVDRLRALRDQPGDQAGDRGRIVHLLAAADPANPYGAALPWPRRDDADRRPFQRAAGAYVALVDGEAAVYVDRGGTSIATFAAADDPAVLDAALRGLGALLADGRVRELVLTKVDGEPVATSPRREAMLNAGFVAGYRGLVLRAPGADPERLAARPAVTRSYR
ncbi:MAG: DEAD/DEAH box helicase [Chloroflexota bacterium]